MPSMRWWWLSSVLVAASMVAGCAGQPADEMVVSSAQPDAVGPERPGRPAEIDCTIPDDAHGDPALTHTLDGHSWYRFEAGQAERLGAALREAGAVGHTLLDALVDEGALEALFIPVRSLRPTPPPLDARSAAVLADMAARGQGGLLSVWPGEMITAIVPLTEDGSVVFESACGWVDQNRFWTEEFVSWAALARDRGGFDPAASDLDVLLALIGDHEAISALIELEAVVAREEMEPGWDAFDDEDRYLDWLEPPAELQGRLVSGPVMLRLPPCWVDPDSPALLCARVDVGWSPCAAMIAAETMTVWHMWSDGTSPLELYLAENDDPAARRVLVATIDATETIVKPTLERNDFPVVTITTAAEGTVAETIARLADGGEVPIEIAVSFMRD